MGKYFSLEMPFTRFLRNVAAVSLLALIPLLVIYVSLRPGFTAMLIENPTALSRFLRQVVTNGLPIVIAANYVGFFRFARAFDRPNAIRSRFGFVLGDMALRLIVFFVLHAVIYVVSADWFGSFGGDRITALRTVAPTLARSALFENLSGVYLYATLLGALPIYVQVLDRARRPTDAAAPAHRRIRPMLAALVLLAFFAVLVSGTAALLMGLQSAGQT